jgi:hypothetical protein
MRHLGRGSRKHRVMRALAHIIINKNPGAMVVATGAEMLGSWIDSNVLQHVDGGRQAA